MLTEARVILPGVQALLGFQFVVMLTKSFEQLSPAVRMAHLVGLVSLVLAIVLLIAPAVRYRGRIVRVRSAREPLVRRATDSSAPKSRTGWAFRPLRVHSKPGPVTC
jgi:hypothetical protein